MSELQRTASRRRRWRAWAGDAVALERLTKIVRTAGHAVDADSDVEMSALDVFGDEMAGDPNDFLREFRPDRIRKMYVEAAGVKIVWNERGVSLRMSGDAAMVRTHYPLLYRDIAAGVPWWSFIRRQWVESALLVAAIGSLAFLWFLAVDKLFTDIWIVVLVGLVLPFVASLSLSNRLIRLIQRLFDRAFPAFEITPPNTSGRGAKVLAYIGGLLASFVVGWLTNQVS